MGSGHTVGHVAAIPGSDLVAGKAGGARRATLRLIKRSAGAFSLLSLTAMGPARADTASSIFLGGGAAIAIIAGEILQLEQPDRNRAYLTLGGGQFDVYNREAPAGYFHVEYRPPWQVWRLKPMVGAFVTTHRALAAYIGTGYDLNIGEHFVVNLNMAAVFFSHGQGKNLGSFFLPRLGVELGYRFSDGTRVTASLHHMSHGEVFGDLNPGSDVAALSVHIPISVLENWLRR